MLIITCNICHRQYLTTKEFRKHFLKHYYNPIKQDFLIF